MRLILFNSITLILLLFLFFWCSGPIQLDIANFVNCNYSIYSTKTMQFPYKYCAINDINSDVFIHLQPDASICMSDCLFIIFIKRCACAYNVEITVNSKNVCDTLKSKWKKNLPRKSHDKSFVIRRLTIEMRITFKSTATFFACVLQYHQLNLAAGWMPEWLGEWVRERRNHNKNLINHSPHALTTSMRFG